MNDKGNRYALAALKTQRATLAGEIVQLKKRLAWAEQQLIHVDATLHLLDPSADPSAIPLKRPQKRIKLFRQGELGRMILAALRHLEKPAPLTEIVTEVLAAGGHGEDARPALTHRVRSNLEYLKERGTVRKVGERHEAKWALA